MATYLAVLGASGALALALPTGIQAPVTVKYRVDQSLTQEVDASATGAEKQVLRFSTSTFVTVTLTDSAGGRTMRVVIDSMKGDSATPIPAAVMDSARGGEFRAFLDRSGKPSPLTPTGTSPAATQVQGLLSDFFPWVRAGLKVGEAWADTSVNTTGAGTDTVTVRRVTNYKAAASEPRGAVRAVKVTSEHTSRVSGNQPTPQGTAKIEGTGNGSGTYFVSPDGRYLGGEWQLHSELRLSGAFAKEPVPVTVTQTTKVTAVR
ncbi:MAG TPA: hypothetical protein VG500_11195 [Gemmatimonadales bacterium]|jgi:hypothetical protein|nr:hypothetical protein [Gemmatimonadales bacterium]